VLLRPEYEASLRGKISRSFAPLFRTASLFFSFPRECFFMREGFNGFFY